MESLPLELELAISSATDLKNVNWRHGNLKPYAVVWVDPKFKFSTKVDDDGDTSPTWDETLLIPLTSPIQDSAVSIEIVHSCAAEDTKPLIGSARIPLQEIVDDVGVGEWAHRSLQLHRPSGRPQGRLEVKILVREPHYRGAPCPYYAAPYGHYPAPYSYSYSNPVPYPYSSASSGYPYNQMVYGTSGYSGVAQDRSNGFGMGTGLAVGALAGVLGGLALAEGFDYVEDKIADDVEERVEDDLGYCDDGFGEDDS